MALRAELKVISRVLERQFQALSEEAGSEEVGVQYLC